MHQILIKKYKIHAINLFTSTSLINENRRVPRGDARAIKVEKRVLSGSRLDFTT